MNNQSKTPDPDKEELPTQKKLDQLYKLIDGIDNAMMTTRTSDGVSVNGLAKVTQDRAKIRELYRADWKAYLGDEGGAKDGGPEDPRIALIELEAQTATYMKSNQPKVVTMLKLAKALITGQPPKLGTLGELNKSELGQGQGRS